MNRMARRREELKLSQEAVAIKAELSARGYRLIEIGVTRNPRYDSLTRIANVLGCRVEDIWPVRRESA